MTSKSFSQNPVSKPVLIAEFGNCHDGSIKNVRDMIRIAKECGATHAKGQAFLVDDIKGSMQPGFYRMRELSVQNCHDLILYGREIGIPVFFSVFSKEFNWVWEHQPFKKFSAGQSTKYPKKVEAEDAENVFVSVNLCTRLPWVEKAEVMYATPYLPDDPGLGAIDFLSEFYGRRVGYSDHTVGIDWCKLAIEEYAVRVIEKHFTLHRDIHFQCKQFRDAIHSADPKQLTQLAKVMR